MMSLQAVIDFLCGLGMGREIIRQEYLCDTQQDHKHDAATGGRWWGMLAASK